MRFSIQGLALIALVGFANSAPAYTQYEHVAVFSVDGLHSSDVPKYVALRPKSTIASLLDSGYEFTNAWTSGPSDSFPGTLFQFTGASPKTTGVWYDVIYDRAYFAPGSTCSGKPGNEVADDETLDFDSTKLFSGGINPQNLPLKLVNGVCTPIWPHQRVRVNTVFEVVHSKGGVTAYADKHPAYDIVRGPSGEGLSTGYFPEIAAVPTVVDDTISYDQLHVNAFLSWLDGQEPANSQGSLGGKIPTLFGGNFQAVSVGQKTVGYLNGPGFPFTAPLLKALDFVDASLAKVVSKLKAKGIYDKTLIIVASKHGQAPIDPTKYGKVPPANVIAAAKVPIAYQAADDIALMFLEKQADLSAAVAGLESQRAALKIQDIIYGKRLIDMGFGNPEKDSAVPDIIVVPELGTIYTTSSSKIAEHGGLSQDDRNVACFVSNPHLAKKTFDNKVLTKQIGPTILKALGIDPKELEGAEAEKTETLNGF